MTSKCRGFIAPTARHMIEALHSQGFVLFRDLPLGTTIRIRRGMFVVRFP
ncbi:MULTISPECIES: hypothetical protein [unclassified Pseudomonas]|nr:MULTISPECIES: hypothetical protein [unclassified Pseudomonas]HDS1695776.1 hypothetical protein [Pseudomonas putida]MBP2270798.1 hypothetical protein [Pseudomonas sp. BP6]MBP2284919.1 hypothetical protein [Pseudomonas sp. BP7]MBP2290183.1 hypothetical protein [Pseudomonas sp. BP7]HDS1700998.1 hypothetical protein [Pseudomonas putida]